MTTRCTDTSDPVPVNFGPNLFDPPFGLKQLNESWFTRSEMDNDLDQRLQYRCNQHHRV